MPEELHKFTVQSEWSGGSGGEGRLRGNGYELTYARPEQLGGIAGIANPEELLLASVVSCYTITFAILAERRRLPVDGIKVDADADVLLQLGGTLKYRAIRLRPTITLNGGDSAQENTALDSAHKAEQYCVISNALRGNVDITVEPTIQHE